MLHPAQHFTWCTLHRSWISRMTVDRLDVLIFQFRTRKLFSVWFQLLFLGLHSDFPGSSKVVRYSHLLKNFPQFVVWVMLPGIKGPDSWSLSSFQRPGARSGFSQVDYRGHSLVISLASREPSTVLGLGEESSNSCWILASGSSIVN